MYIKKIKIIWRKKFIIFKWFIRTITSFIFIFIFFLLSNWYNDDRHTIYAGYDVSNQYNDNNYDINKYFKLIKNFFICTLGLDFEIKKILLYGLVVFLVINGTCNIDILMLIVLLILKEN